MVGLAVAVGESWRLKTDVERQSGDLWLRLESAYHLGVINPVR
jgi:hypothetical protein